MSGYELTKAWFAFCKENPDKAKPIHTALLTWIIESANEAEWSEKFRVETKDAMRILGIAHSNTYTKAMDELEEWGIIEYVTHSKNQWTCNVIRFGAELKNSEAHIEAHSKATEQHVSKHIAEHMNGTVPVNKTNNILNNKINNISFAQFWDAYGKKVDTKKCQAKWDKLSDDDKESIMKHVPKYILSSPDIKFRKNPLTYLNGECWKDEIPASKPDNTIPLNPAYPTADISKVDPYNKPWEILGTEWYKKVFPASWDQMSMEGILEYNFVAKTYQMACALPAKYQNAS